MLIKESRRSGTNTVGVTPEKNRIQVHGQQFFFCIVTLQFNGSNPLFHFNNHHLKRIPSGKTINSSVSGVQRFCPLLRNGTPPAGALLPKQYRFNGYSDQSPEIYTGMPVET